MAGLSDEDVNRIAEAVVERAAEGVGVRDIMIGSVMGKGAIPLYGRETRKEPCACCLIDPEGPNAPENRMCTTKGAIGTLSDREEREWCSEIKIVPDGRCTRARAISEAARECKEKYPEDTEAFFKCYIPAFSQITKGSNPAGLTTKTKDVSKLEVRIPLELLWKDEPNYLDKLTEEIREHGITEPITIRVREDGSMIVWDGLHRLAVAQKLGIEQIPVIYIGGAKG
ncbi:hypothetical protein ES703_112591 [subsurface metagenome]